MLRVTSVVYLERVPCMSSKAPLFKGPPCVILT